MANTTASNVILASGSATAGNVNAHVSAGGGNSGLSISLHPLPILSISEHYTRATLQHPSSSPSSDLKIIGALLGTQTGREVSIVNTFELCFMPGSRGSGGSGGGEGMDVDGQVGGKFVLDRDFLSSRRDQFKEVFPTLDLIGWYSVGPRPDGVDVDIQAQMQDLIDTPLFLLLNPPSPGPPISSDLPLKVYESALGGESSENNITTLTGPSITASTATSQGTEESGARPTGTKFVELSYTVETGEAERIAVDGAAKAGGLEEDGNVEESGLIASLTTQRNAINMLSDRIKVLLEYVRGVVEGTAKIDHAVLREISATVATLPVMSEESFKEEFMTEYNDVELTGYLAELTRSLAVLNDIADKTTTIASKLDDPLSGLDRLTGPANGGGGGGGGRSGYMGRNKKGGGKGGFGGWGR